MHARVSLVFFLTVEDLDLGTGFVTPEADFPIQLSDEDQERLIAIVEKALTTRENPGQKARENAGQKARENPGQKDP